MNTRKRLLNIILVFFVALILPQAYAQQPVTPTIILKSIQQKSASESHDEIYFVITDLNNETMPFYTMPGKKAYPKQQETPMPTSGPVLMSKPHWRDSDLFKVKNLVLWSRPITNKEGSQISLTLVEADLPPINFDDTLGTVNINFFNINGEIKTQVAPYANAKILNQRKNGASEVYKIDIKHQHANYQFEIEIVK